MLLDDTPKNKQKMSDEEKMVRYIAKTVAIVLVIIVLAMTSCTMHSNTYDDDRLVEEAKVQEAENVETKLKEETKQKRIQAIETLIREGKNPMAVKCALSYDLSRADKEKCHVLGMVLGGQKPIGYDNR